MTKDMTAQQAEAQIQEAIGLLIGDVATAAGYLNMSAADWETYKATVRILQDLRDRAADARLAITSK